MGKQKQIGLENYLKFGSVKFLTKYFLKRLRSTQTVEQITEDP